MGHVITTLGGGGALGSRAGSENDTLLPLTMTHDWRKFRKFKSYHRPEEKKVCAICLMVHAISRRGGMRITA